MLKERIWAVVKSLLVGVVLLAIVRVLPVAANEELVVRVVSYAVVGLAALAVVAAMLCFMVLIIIYVFGSLLAQLFGSLIGYGLAWAGYLWAAYGAFRKFYADTAQEWSWNVLCVLIVYVVICLVAGVIGQICAIWADEEIFDLTS